MNKTNFEHAGYALLMQCFFGLLLGEWVIGAVFAFCFFLGREHAQYERKLKDKGMSELKATFQAFMFWQWSLDAQLDLLFPLIAVSSVLGLVLP